MYKTCRQFYPNGIEGESVDCTFKEFKTFDKAVDYCHRYARGIRFVCVDIEDEEGNTLYEMLADGQVFDYRKKGIGVCGILKPNGEFLECSYGGHSLLMRYAIPIKEQEKCIFFSSPKEEDLGVKNGSNIDCEAWENGITLKQLNWVLENKDFFDQKQAKMIVGILEDILNEKIKVKGLARSV